ncbi:MAG: hypothetical protein JXA87_00275 [Thermoleophilia bacterium]|nr:hypothetical protein [Thermoleophilia bacterium]
MAGSDTLTEGLFPPFDRRFLEGDEAFSRIGSGELGGKAAGLAFIRAAVLPVMPALMPTAGTVSVPTLAVITTDVFDAFLARNDLLDTARSDLPDDRIAHAFHRAELPAEFLGDLEALVQKTHVPLAVRSSSMLEDALAHPFAGTYATKMIPNNQHMADDRFLGLTEAIKFVYASTFFAAAKAYRAAVGVPDDSEKMAVIVQEVVGHRHGDRFYPEVSGVARSYNYYPMPHSRPEDGIVGLALGLGKTIVDGGACWGYDPSRPAAPPPAASPHAVLAETQNQFWAVNMGHASYDPLRETEYMIRSSLSAAEADDTLHFVASTYDPESDRLCPGVGRAGPRVIDFGPLLSLRLLPLNECIRAMLAGSKEAMGQEVEIEFAATLGHPRDPSLRVGFLQVRPMAAPGSTVAVAEDELHDQKTLVASRCCLGNGVLHRLRDIVYVRPETFDPAKTARIAEDLASINRTLLASGERYILLGFGRWGTSDPWLGVPVEWGQISGASVIVEAALPSVSPEMSQGSHFFHNLIGSNILYLSVPPEEGLRVDWDWLGEQEVVNETESVRHVRTQDPVSVRVDGTSRRGVIDRG